MKRERVLPGSDPIRRWLLMFQDEYVDTAGWLVSALVLLRCSDGDHCDHHHIVSSGDNIARDGAPHCHLGYHYH